jgi:hypothetical protein
MVAGVPEPLPAGEALLWEGAPDWRTLAIRRFHARKIAVYFGLLLVWRAASGWGGEDPIAHLAAGAIVLVPLGALAVAAAMLLAWLVARTTTYAITDRRVVMRVGIALPAVINVPLRFVDAVSSQTHPDGTGDLALALERDNRFAWLLLWPHVRPWRFSEAEPSMIGVPDVADVGERLRQALTSPLEASDRAAPGEPNEPAPPFSMGVSSRDDRAVPERAHLARVG